MMRQLLLKSVGLGLLLLSAAMLVSCHDQSRLSSRSPETLSSEPYFDDLAFYAYGDDSITGERRDPRYRDRSRGTMADRESRVGPSQGNRDWQNTVRLSAAFSDAMPSREEELWVITTYRGDTRAQDPMGPGALGCGAMMTRFPGEEREIAIPLEFTEVDAEIAGYIGSVNVKQRYHNPFGVKIEAVYAFPLPQNAAVNGFLMTIGDRTIRGIIREKEEAERIYNQARAQGKVASMMSQVRPNIFTQQVANIEPGRAIDIDITYHQTIAYDDGWHEWVFPMTIGPRYNPSGSSNGVGAVPRGAKHASKQHDEVQYLSPGETTGHRIGLEVHLDAGVEIEAIDCPTHKVEIRRGSGHDAVVRLSPYDDLPNKDFVLRYRVEGDSPRASLLTHRAGRDGYFSLVLYPPSVLERLERGPMEMIFVLDCSGSMSGEPLAQSKAAVERGLEMLRPEDTFQIMRFSDNASAMGAEPLPATSRNIRRAHRYLSGLRGQGGTQMIEGIREALRSRHDRSRQRFVVFLTDGFIGNEAAILGAVHKHLGDARVFSFGVGSSPNRFLMDRMAKIGRGAVAYLGAGDQGDDVMERFFERASRPAMTSISLEADGVELMDVYPSDIPDLFVGRPVIMTGRFKGNRDASVRISGKVGRRQITMVAPLDLNNAENEHPAIATIWARHRIADLVDESSWKGIGGVTRAIRNTALDYNLVSAFTSFIAVDSLSQTGGGYGVTVDVPVHVPEGVRYQTSVGK